MNVLLVRPKFSSIVANLEPLGLEYLGGLLRDIQYPYEIFDEFNYSGLFRLSRLKKKVKNGNFDCIGFNANANTVDYIITAARYLKTHFENIFVMVGGPEAELNYADFCVDGIDFVYHDNGMESLKSAFKSQFDPTVLSELNGVCFQKEGQWINREKGPPVNGFITKPDRSELYKNIKKNFMFMKDSFAISKASFSCPFDCNFCYCTKMNSDTYTERDLDDVLDEVEELDVERIWFVDDTFCVDKKRVEIFCNAVIERGIKKHFMVYSRADFLAETPEILPLMYEAGFRDILVGLEAVDDKMLDEYNKKTSRQMNIDAVKNLRDNNIVCNGLFVVSHRSTKKDFKNLMDFIKETGLLWVVFGIFTPYKGTDAHEEYKDRLHNFKSRRLDGIHITIKPEHMSSFMFMARVYLLHVKTYPKIIFRRLMGTAYDTKRTGWLK